jgi:Phage integrase, N-terminal SAM-like domain
VRFVSGSGQVRYRLGARLVDRYLEFVAGWCRPNTLRAVVFDLKAFFTVINKGPVQVTAADVFEFLVHQRGHRSVVRLTDRESGLSARTIARRLSSVSDLDTLCHRLRDGSRAKGLVLYGKSLVGLAVCFAPEPGDLCAAGRLAHARTCLLRG